MLSRQSKLVDTINNYNTVENYIRTNSDFHFMVFDILRNRVIATNSEDFTKKLITKLYLQAMIFLM